MSEEVKDIKLKINGKEMNKAEIEAELKVL